MGTPIHSEPSQTITDLREAVKTRKLGFGPEFVERTTSPFVAQRQANFPGERRDIEESYASRGLGRSTIAGREVGQAVQQKERDINQLIAEAQLKNLMQEKQDEARQESNLFNIGNIETQQSNQAALNEQQRRQYQIGTEQGRDLAETQALQFGAGLALKPILPAVGGAFEKVGTSVGGGLGEFITNVGKGAGGQQIEGASAFTKNQTLDQILAALAAK